MRKLAVILATGTAVVALTLLTTRLVNSTPEDQDAMRSTASRASRSAQNEVGLKSPEASGESGAGSSSGASLPMDQTGGVVSPIPIPHEFDLVSPDKVYWHAKSWRDLHARLEREPFDPDWSPAAEEAVRSAVNNNPEITSRANPTINCRTTLCEVQIVVHGGDAKVGEWSSHFRPVVKQLKSEGFNLEDFSEAHQDNVTTVAFVVSRYPGQQ